MNRFYRLVEEICLEDKRYKPDAYEFVLQGLGFTQKKLKKNAHVSGSQLSGGLRDLRSISMGLWPGGCLSIGG